ncbi:MAG: hypothetical protein ACRELD_16900, partial [Longimicrobiales bacterium]
MSVRIGLMTGVLLAGLGLGGDAVAQEALPPTQPAAAAETQPGVDDPAVAVAAGGVVAADAARGDAGPRRPADRFG